MINLVQREPAIIIAIADALLLVAVSFGLPIDATQKTAIDALLAVIGGFIVRSQVSPK